MTSNLENRDNDNDNDNDNDVENGDDASNANDKRMRRGAFMSWLLSSWAWLWLSLIMLPLFPVAAIYRWLRRDSDPRGDGLRRLIARWVSIYGETTPLYRFDVRGKSNLPATGPYVLVANHESGLDVLCLLMLRTPARFVAEDFLFALPLAGWLFRASKQIPVKVGDRESGSRALKYAAQAVAEGTPVAFFPEGRLSPDEMIRFKPGAFLVAQRAGVPIVPVLIEGAGQAWRPGTMVVRGRHRIGIRILDPIPPETSTATDAEQLARDVRQRLLDAREEPAARGGARAAVLLGLAALGLAAGAVSGCASALHPYEIAPTERLLEIDETGFDSLLEGHVADGVVEYAAFCGAPVFDRYVADLARVDLSSADDEQRKGFYINAYNALSIQGILDGSSPGTLLGRYGFFVRDRYQVAGREMNLLALEREVLIPMQDPRIHFAIVCASTSCPVLRSGVYADADELDAQLDDATRGFVNDTERNQFDAASGSVRLSRIFDWYREEFEASAGSLAAYVARYVDDPATAEQLRAGTLEIEFGDYDWRRNGASPGPKGRCPAVSE